MTRSSLLPCWSSSTPEIPGILDDLQFIRFVKNAWSSTLPVTPGSSFSNPGSRPLTQSLDTFQSKPKYHLELDETTERALTADRNLEKNLFPAEKDDRKRKWDEDDDDGEGGGDVVKKKSE